MFTNTKDYQKSWNTFVGFDFLGQPQFQTETQHLLISRFDEYFIHYLSDYLPTLTINPEGDGLDRYKEFKDLYIQCRLDAQHEYEKNQVIAP